MVILDNVTFGYPQQKWQFNLHVAAGELIAIFGPSGSGKSTLLDLIAGFIQPEKGKLYLAGKTHINTVPMQRPVSTLLQKNNLFPHLTVAQNIALGVHPGLKLTPSQWSQIDTLAHRMLLADFLKHLPRQLSGGQQQRVALARCFMRQQPILLLDEPFAALDPVLRRTMMTLLLELRTKKALTILLVSHQVDEIRTLASQVVIVENGESASYPTQGCTIGETIHGAA